MLHLTVASVALRKPNSKQQKAARFKRNAFWNATPICFLHLDFSGIFFCLADLQSLPGTDRARSFWKATSTINLGKFFADSAINAKTPLTHMNQRRSF